MKKAMKLKKTKHGGISFVLEHSPYLDLLLCGTDRTVKRNFCSLIWFARSFSIKAVRRPHQPSASPLNATLLCFMNQNRHVILY